MNKLRNYQNYISTAEFMEIVELLFHWEFFRSSIDGFCLLREHKIAKCVIIEKNSGWRHCIMEKIPQIYWIFQNWVNVPKYQWRRSIGLIRIAYWGKMMNEITFRYLKETICGEIAGCFLILITSLKVFMWCKMSLGWINSWVWLRGLSGTLTMQKMIF